MNSPAKEILIDVFKFLLKPWSNRAPRDKNGSIFVHRNNLENLATQIYQLEYGLDGLFSLML